MTWTRIAIICIALASGACSRPATIVTPQGRAAFTADQIVLRLTELERAAIQANAAGGLDVNTTRLIVRFTVSAERTMQQAPQGWQPTVIAAWNEVKRALPPIGNPAITAALTAIDLVLAAVGGSS